MYCKHCGKKIPDNSKFCKNCGKDVSESPSVVTPPEKEKPQRKSNVHIFVGVIIAIVIIVVGGIGLDLTLLAAILIIIGGILLIID